MNYAQGQADIAGGDLFQFGGSAIPLANTPTNSFASNLAYYGPCSIRSQTTIGSWGICGDSRNALIFNTTAPYSDAADNIWGVAGQVGRLVGKRVPLVNVSVPGETAADFAIATQSPVRRTLLKQARSGGFVMLGTNDIIFQNQASAATKTKLDQIAADLGWSSTGIYGTLDPAVNSGNTAPRQPDSAPNYPETNRRAFNTTVRGLTRRFDPAASNESGGASSPAGVYASASYVSSDGTHETAAGNQNAADNAGFDVGLIGSPAILNAGFAYPSGALYQSLGLADSWGPAQVTPTFSGLYSPEHRITATVLKEDATASAIHCLIKTPSFAISGATRTFTVFVKRVSGSRNFRMQVQRTNDYAGPSSFFNLGTGAVVYSDGGATAVAATAVEDWWKVTMTCAFAAGSNANPYVLLKMTDSGNSDTYNGDNTSSVALWGLDVR